MPTRCSRRCAGRETAGLPPVTLHMPGAKGSARGPRTESSARDPRASLRPDRNGERDGGVCRARASVVCAVASQRVSPSYKIGLTRTSGLRSPRFLSQPTHLHPLLRAPQPVLDDLEAGLAHGQGHDPGRSRGEQERTHHRRDPARSPAQWLGVSRHAVLSLRSCIPHIGKA